MRILHTSDWHLGRTLHGVDLLNHQAQYLDHLVELARAEAVDAVLISGDVYDRAIPPVQAVELLAATLRQLSEITTVVVTSGNHDSAVRLGFGAELMRESLQIRTGLDRVAEPILLSDKAGEQELLIYALPYLDPDAARAHWATDAPDLARSHEAVVTHAMNLVRTDLAARHVATRGTAAQSPTASIVMAHAFVLGGAASESERDIRVGGVDSVPASAFAGVTYGALGHLHGPQKVNFSLPDAAPIPPPQLRYSGSPLAYSFSERNQVKSTVLLDLAAGQVQDLQLIPAPVPRKLSEVRGTLDEVLGEAGAAQRNDWVRVIVTDAQRPPDLISRVRQAFPHMLQTFHQPDRPATREQLVVVSAASDPVAVASGFVEHVTGAPPSPAEHLVLQDAVEAVQRAERSA